MARPFDGNPTALTGYTDRLQYNYGIWPAIEIGASQAVQ